MDKADLGQFLRPTVELHLLHGALEGWIGARCKRPRVVATLTHQATKSRCETNRGFAKALQTKR